MYGQSTNKRQKTINSRETTRNLETNDFFPGFNRVEFRTDAAYEDTLTYQFYNATERIHGRAMEEWLRPCISFRNAFCHSDYPSNSTLCKLWDDGSHSEENYKRRLKAAFELYSKLGVKYWTLYDVDIAPEGDSLEESNHAIDESVQLILELQQRTGIKPLWVAADLKTNSRYASGGVTSPEAHVTGYAGAQLKKALELAHKLGAENFLFKGFQEGYTSILNTDVPRELRNYSRVLKMIVDYKERLGYRGQLLLEPYYIHNYESNKKSEYFIQYNYTHDITSALCFLKHYGLDRHYKLSVPIGDQLYMAAAYGILGSIDATNLKHLTDVPEATLLYKTVIEQGGIQPGGLNIGVPLARESAEVKDLFVAYINQIDKFARGLRKAVKVVEDGLFSKNLQQRYLSFHTGFGSRLASGEATLEDCEDQVRKAHGEAFTSGRTEHWEAVFSRYL